MTTVRPHGQAEGWMSDPFGRHELRFFDGHRWTPYVRDGDRNGLDQPGGPVGEHAATRTALLDEDVFVVERFTDLGRRWSDRQVLRPDGTRAGTLRRGIADPGRTPPTLTAALLRDRARKDVVELVDDKDHLVLTLARPTDVPRSWVEVRDADGRDAGRIVQTLRGRDTTFSFRGSNGEFLGDLETDNWVGWDLRIVDSHARQVATITRSWAGLDRSLFNRPDDYVVRITDAIHEPLRVLVVACALSLEVVVKPDSLGP